VASNRNLFFRLFSWQVLPLLIGTLGLAWGISDISRGLVSGQFLELEAHLLRFETFSETSATRIIENSAAWNLNPCDNHTQRALLLLEAPLAVAALRAGAVKDFDRHIGSVEVRSKQVLACVTRDSLVWLVLFGLEVLHGHLDHHTFDLLSVSYETSPTEAWVGTRRIAVALPVVLAAPEPVRQKILTEFQDLVRNRFVEIPAHSYMTVSPPVRALLQSRIEELDSPSQKAFFESLQSIRP
jgi:hypothetical protein